MTDFVALAAALLHAPEASRLIEIGDTTLTLSVGETRFTLSHLPDAVLRVQIHPSGPGEPLSGWAVDTRDLAPVPAVLLVEAKGALTPAHRLSRPDIRAAQGSDHDMTGFVLRRPEAASASLLFILQDGGVTKRLAL